MTSGSAIASESTTETARRALKRRFTGWSDCVGYRWFQTFSILFVPSLNALTITRKNPEGACPGAFRREHWPGAPAPGRCGCLFSYAVPSAGLSNGSGILLPFPFW
jgi:hypothetical protein